MRLSAYSIFRRYHRTSLFATSMLFCLVFSGLAPRTVFGSIVRADANIVCALFFQLFDRFSCRCLLCRIYFSIRKIFLPGYLYLYSFDAVSCLFRYFFPAERNLILIFFLLSFQLRFVCDRLFLFSCRLYRFSCQCICFRCLSFGFVCVILSEKVSDGAFCLDPDKRGFRAYKDLIVIELI